MNFTDDEHCDNNSYSNSYKLDVLYIVLCIVLYKNCALTLGQEKIVLLLVKFFFERLARQAGRFFFFFAPQT